MLDGKSHESYRITPFFLKCEKLLTEIKNSKQETDISHIIAMLEINLKRPLSRTEQETVSGWFEDSFTKGEIETAIKYVKSGKSAANEIDAISGCTITNNATTKAVNGALCAVNTIQEEY